MLPNARCHFHSHMHTIFTHSRDGIYPNGLNHSPFIHLSYPNNFIETMNNNNDETQTSVSGWVKHAVNTVIYVHVININSQQCDTNMIFVQTYIPTYRFADRDRNNEHLIKEVWLLYIVLQVRWFTKQIRRYSLSIISWARRAGSLNFSDISPTQTLPCSQWHYTSNCQS